VQTLRPRAARASVLPNVDRVDRPRSVSTGAASRLPSPPAVLWLPALLVVVLAVLPLGYLVVRAAEAGPLFWETVLRERTARVVLNSALLAAVVAGSTALLAVPLAWLTTCTDLPGRRLWGMLATLPIVVPSYVGALAVVAAFGPRGSLQGMLESLGVDRLPSIYGFWGTWLTLTLFTYPYVLLAVRAALHGIDPALAEAARGLGHGPWRVFGFTTLPQVRPAIAGGALLAALYALGDFGVPTLLRFDTFTRAVFVQYRSAMDRSAAAALALLLVTVTIGLIVVETRLRGSATLHRIGSGAARRPKPVPLGRWKAPAVVFCGLTVALALGLPLLVLTGWLVQAARAGAAFEGLGIAALHSLSLGGWTALAATAAALPLALLAVRFPGRWGMLAERVGFLGFALPGIVVALAFVALGVRTPFHQTLALLVAAYAVRFLPEAVGANRLSLLQINPRLEEAARGLGASTVAAIRRVTVPLARPGLLAGASLVLLTTMKELPVTLLLSPTGYDTLATRIWTAANDASYGQAAAPALLLVVVSAVPTLLLAARDRTRA